jgi:hypothetical protein
MPPNPSPGPFGAPPKAARRARRVRDACGQKRAPSPSATNPGVGLVLAWSLRDVAEGDQPLDTDPHCPLRALWALPSLPPNLRRWPLRGAAEGGQATNTCSPSAGGNQGLEASEPTESGQDTVTLTKYFVPLRRGLVAEGDGARFVTSSTH